MRTRPLFAIPTLLLLGLLAAGILAGPALANSPKPGGKADADVSIPPDATPEQVRAVLAGMSDEQVRRLLIRELNAAAPAPAAPEESGLVTALRKSKAVAQAVRTRLAALFSGDTAAPRLLPEALRDSLSGRGVYPPGRLALGVAMVLAVWLAVRLLLARRMAGVRLSVEDAPAGTAAPVRAGRLLARAGLDLAAILAAVLITLVPYLIVFDEPADGRPVIFAWLAALAGMAVVRAGLRAALSPDAPGLRFLPLSDQAARYLFRWGLRLAWVVVLGALLSCLVSMAHGPELAYILVLALTGFAAAAMVSLLALWNKRRVAEAIRAATPEGSLRHQLAGAWASGVIAYAMVFWLFWVVALLAFGRKALSAGVATLLLLPGYLLADWMTQRLVAFAVNMAGVPAAKGEDGDGEGARPPISKFERFLSAGFRILVAAGAVFALLRAWGADIRFGRNMVDAGLNTLITLVLAYIFWIFISNFIERKLRDKHPAGDRDHGEGDGGGHGGDRFSTLLQLVRKFIFAAITVISVLVILSSLGVDIGPLIAGASVFGIAIGFGAQTLVKDIISGIFFLMDDAFRVGDYIETGSAMGTVEEISVRSIKLRHHLGFLYTIPFGSMKLIKNNSRDWAVMKLKYTVPFDTDLQKVKKVIKRINKEIRAVPELDEMMLSDIKSQGVKAMEEYGMLMRVKFMTKPGGQFTLRKLVLAKMRKYFAEEGVEFAKPRVTVHMPVAGDFGDEERAALAAAATRAMEKKEEEKE
ncbi:mechanosensitive ion channel family protein [Pseudodesulfovibrio sp.]|uniref:mechanosensitive ion channel family protein n=1 Tax=Pseudodesulfovibrio sp. TaxID=2035812 RepID=UPI002621E53B|nr:mechanosensitive ion channel family protein [Pseudodesulfovibrio sp.]MDD3311437.1 mechanosensitive ion channel [Pseudodesulfovibrio sp.]